MKALSTTEVKKEGGAAGEEDEKKTTCWDFKWADRYVQSPSMVWMAIWTAVALTVNTISIFVVFYECAFRMRGLSEPGALNTVFEIILLLEIILIFFKSYPGN